MLAFELAVNLSPIGLDMTPRALVPAAANSAVSSAVSVISAGNGPAQPGTRQSS